MSSKTGSDFRGRYLRRLPSVGKMLEHPKVESASGICPRVLLVRAAQEVVDGYKKRILTAQDENQVQDIDLSPDRIADEVSALAVRESRMGLRRCINATGNVLDNRLGRTPLGESARKALKDIAGGYSTLAVDAETGESGDRCAHVQKLLSILTESEAGLVVNNNAGAIMLLLNTIADGKEVIVSRGQLIESDGFRLPDVIGKSGAKLVTIGATNKTHLRDYENAVGENTGAIMKIHKSSYRIAGFSQDVPIQELVQLGKKRNIPIIDNVGTGCLSDLMQYGLTEEPHAVQSIRSGADIVCFSGDKLLGGPQSGIVIGSDKYLSAMRSNALYRVLRVDKLILAALEATLRDCLSTSHIPIPESLSRPLAEIDAVTRSLADSLAERLSGVAAVVVEDGLSQVDSIASAPERFPTKLVSVKPTKVSADALARRLRLRAVPIFALIRDGCLILDLRTVGEDESDEIVKGLAECCQP